MLFIARVAFLIIFTISLFPALAVASSAKIPILCYHNLNPTKRGSMNMTPEKFESQIKYLQDNHFNIIPLTQVVEYLKGKRDSLPSKPIAITVDDGWKSVYSYMRPIILKHKIPVTLFIYPQTISAGKNSMTWDELNDLQQTGLFDIQSHTYDHPNFKVLKRKFSSSKFDDYVRMQLVKSKKILEDKMGKKIALLAWPFGIYNQYLEQQAARAGYEMAFTINYEAAKRGYSAMAQPRFMIIDSLSTNTFKGIVNQAR